MKKIPIIGWKLTSILGVEHAILHLFYARFFTRALKYCGYLIKFEEPFRQLLTQGMVTHVIYQDKDGKWLSPQEVMRVDNQILKVSDRSTVGRLENDSKSKKYGRPARDFGCLWHRYSKIIYDV